jgi:hypothetical protein
LHSICQLFFCTGANKINKNPLTLSIIISIKIELPKIATSDIPEVYSKMSNPGPEAEVPDATPRHNREPPNSFTDSMKFPLTRPIKSMLLSPVSGSDVVETIAL